MSTDRGRPCDSARKKDEPDGSGRGRETGKRDGGRGELAEIWRPHKRGREREREREREERKSEFVPAVSKLARSRRMKKKEK